MKIKVLLFLYDQEYYRAKNVTVADKKKVEGLQLSPADV